MKLMELSAETFLDRVAGPEPTPGGGSASALAGALAAALVEMVCVMPKTKSALAQEREWLNAAGRAAKEAGAELRALVEEDAAAFEGVMAAFRLPKASEDEKARRSDAVTAAMRRATTVPMQTAEACLRVLEAAREAADHGNQNARSDAKTGAALAWAGLLGALENVRINAAQAAWGKDALRRADALQREAQERARALELLR